MPLPLGTCPISILQDCGNKNVKDGKQRQLLFDTVVDEPSDFDFLI